jgi:hypothetical protein
MRPSHHLMLVAAPAALLVTFAVTGNADARALRPASERYRDTSLAPSVGRSGNETVAARALLRADGTTTVSVTTGAFGAPRGLLAQVQVKVDGVVVHVTNDVASATHEVTLAGLVRGQELQVKANVRGVDGNRTEVVTSRAAVALAPDLAPSAPRVSGPAIRGLPVLIVAEVAELNGDVGARATCVLYADGLAVDRAGGIWVDAGDTVSCFFATTFPTAGRRSLVVSVEDVDPADYEPRNDRGDAVELLVAAPLLADEGDYLVGMLVHASEHADTTFYHRTDRLGGLELHETYAGTRRSTTTVETGLLIAGADAPIAEGSRLAVSWTAGDGAPLHALEAASLTLGAYDVEVDGTVEDAEALGQMFRDAYTSGFGAFCGGSVRVDRQDGISVLHACDLSSFSPEDLGPLAPSTMVVALFSRAGMAYLAEGIYSTVTVIDGEVVYEDTYEIADSVYLPMVGAIRPDGVGAWVEADLAIEDGADVRRAAARFAVPTIARLTLASDDEEPVCRDAFLHPAVAPDVTTTICAAGVVELRSQAGLYFSSLEAAERLFDVAASGLPPDVIGTELVTIP